MRLIDADTFKNQVAAAAISNGLMKSSKKANVMLDLIDMQPTAYDMEKVVERLKQNALSVLVEDEHIIAESNVRENYEIEMVALSDAIEIVKAGRRMTNAERIRKSQTGAKKSLYGRNGRRLCNN